MASTTNPTTTETLTEASGVDSIIAAARAGQAVQELDLGSVYARQRADGGVDVLDLAQTGHLGQLVALRRHNGEPPVRKTGQVTLTEAVSFAAYVNDHKVEAHTEVWADRDHGRLVAVLNGHARRDPAAGWGDHRATLELRFTPAWKAWTAINGRQLPQAEFADFLEDNLPDVVEPDGAALLEVATSIQATVGAVVKSAIRTDNGEVQVRYEEQVEGKAGRAGDLTIPTRIALRLTPFEGGEPYRVEARLRWRAGNGSLTLGVVLDRPDDVVRAAFGDLVELVEAETDLVVLHGTPSS